MLVLARILLRYGAGFLIAKGLLAPDFGSQLAVDPDLLAWTQIALGAAAAGISEVWYWAAKKFGWKT